MKICELLTERIQNLHSPVEKQQYAQQVWDIMQKSYANLEGGFATASSPEELIKKSALWKVVTRGGEVTAAVIYKDQFGRKSIALGTNKTVQGKQDVMMIKSGDHKHSRSWAEVSGPVERMMEKLGSKPIPAKFAHILTNKQIDEIHDDGFHYTRMIAGQPHTKIIYGSVRFTQDDIDKLTAAGVQLHELPYLMK